MDITRRSVNLGLGGALATALIAPGAYGAGPLRPDAAVIRQIAPSGRLRAAINVGNVVLAQRGGPRGMQGPTVDIADEMARRLGLPVDLVIYDAAGKVVAGLASDHWDVAFMGVDPARAGDIAFTAPYVYIDGTYMVRDDAPYHQAADLDRAGVRIAVGKGAAYDLYLSRALHNATLVRLPSSPEAITAFTDQHLDAVAGVRQALLDAQKTMPGTRVLADAFNRIEQCVAIPKGRDAALAWAGTVIAELKADGFVRAALDRAGQAGAIVA